MTRTLRIASYNEVQRLQETLWPEELWVLKADYVIVYEEYDGEEFKLRVQSGVNSYTDALLIIHGEEVVSKLRNIGTSWKNGVLSDSDFSGVEDLLDNLKDIK